MDDHASRARHSGAGLLIGPVVALCLVVPVLAGPGRRSQEKNEAEKVAKKMQKALATSEEREALRHFQEEVAEYAELHAKQLAKLGAQDPLATQEALARAIEAKRAQAEPGDIFQPEIQPLFRRLIAEQLEGPDALAARQAVLEGNPGQDEDSAPVVVRVNGEYPIGAPRSTVPPSVLMTLPPLPECLHYRFVSQDLILVDSVAQLVVDVLPAATADLAVK